MSSFAAQVAIGFLRWRLRPLWKNCAGDLTVFRERFNSEVDRMIPTPQGVRRSKLVLGDRSCDLIEPVDAISDRPPLLYFHGGGFVLPLQASQIDFCADLVRRLKIRIYIPDYRLAPEFPFPAPFEDCWAATQVLLKAEPQLSLLGDSAGGAFALWILQKCRETGTPMPQSAVLISPVTGFSGVDLSAEKWEQDHMFDRETFQFFRDAIQIPQEQLVNRDLRGFPPLWVSAAENEALFDDAKLLVDQARKAELACDFFVRPGLFHVFPLSGLLPEAQEARRSLMKFLTTVPTSLSV